MALLDFCTYSDIRAALGVSSDELEDTTLSLELYASNLELELLDVDLTLIEKYTPMIELDTGGMTAVEKRFFQSVRLFSNYVVAKQLTTSLPLFAPKEVTDGKASISRYADSPYKKVIEGVNASYDKYRGWCVDALAKFNLLTSVAAPIRTYMVVSTPSRDPVTGT